MTWRGPGSVNGREIGVVERWLRERGEAVPDRRMIHHHEGGLIMVEELFAIHGAGQEARRCGALTVGAAEQRAP